MNIQQLIKDLCPKGLEWHALGEVGYFFGGVTGKSKKDFENGNSKFITYMNVFSNPKLNIDVKETVFINEGEKQNTLQYGDVLFTTSSETVEESGMSSVLVTETNEKLYLNSFCFGFRFNNLENINPNFYSYIFRSEDLRKQIVKCANGVTRFNISKERFAKITIPIPPISIQNRIVEILDHFTDLISNLNTELDLRRKQLEHYREKMLAFGEGIEWKTLGEVCVMQRGNNVQKSDFTENGVGCIHYGQIYTHYGLSATTTNKYVPKEVAAKAPKAHKNDVVITITSENVEDLCKPVAWLGNEDVAVSSHALILKHQQDAKFMAFLLISDNVRKQKATYAHSGKVTEIIPEHVGRIKIPLPPINVQQNIVATLDKFTTLIDNIEQEITLRKKQYDYYREQLLTF